MLMNSMKLTLLIPLLVTSFVARAAGPVTEFAAGRADYVEGKFRKAADHFQLALLANPEDAETCYWTGMLYQKLADIAMPFGRKNNARAREYLTKAMKLAPDRPEYREALFDFLLDSADSSRTALPAAAAILLSISETDPGYDDMRRRFESERKLNSSAGARLSRLFLAVPRGAYEFAALPASALSSRRDASSLPPTKE